MSKLSTHYLGVELKNPIVVGACDLLENPANLKKIEEAGAGAIVYKSLFEEQIQLEDLELDNQLNEYADRNAEMTSLFPGVEHAGPTEYLLNLKKAVELLNIPVFGSINAVYPETWVKYAKLMEGTGIAGLELNLFNVPFSFDLSAADIEDEQLKIVKSVLAAVSIPVSVKLSQFYTNPLAMVKKLSDAGVKGVVLFNKLFQPDIDPERQKHSTPWNLSSPEEYRTALRYSGLLFGEIKSDVIANTGIYTGKDVIKMLLAGANSVQLVSTLYKNGVNQITEILLNIQVFMDQNGYEDIDSFRGKLSRKNIKNPFIYKRAQYIDALLNSEKLFGRPVL
jgi:dihydroorotate dehydrogenase (fumarate)